MKGFKLFFTLMAFYAFGLIGGSIDGFNHGADVALCATSIAQRGLEASKGERYCKAAKDGNDSISGFIVSSYSRLSGDAL